MSESRKKTYKKRKSAAHIKAKEHVNTKQESKLQHILNEWMWLITLGVIAIIVVLLVVFIPQCKEGGACYINPESCSEKEEPADRNAAAYEEQMRMPAEGEQIAVIETSLGTMKIRLFPQYAPKTVANFVGLVEQGSYNDMLFHRVVNTFMIQTGDTDGVADGVGGTTADGNPLPDEYNNGLYHFCGAVSMAHTGAPESGSSQFFIVQRNSEALAMLQLTGDSLVSNYGYDERVSSFYALLGGTPELDYEVRVASKPADKQSLPHTVFGQLFEGYDVLDKIASVEVTTNAAGEKCVPVEPVTVSSIRLETFHAPETSGTDAQ